MIHFSNPSFLLLILLLIPWVWWMRRRRRPRLAFPSLSPLVLLRRSRWIFLKHAGLIARAAALTLLAVALARPQGGSDKAQKTSEGLDIVLILDTSRSMEARDYTLNGKRPSRLAVVKQVISDFVKERPSDRIGMVVFGTEAFTQAPLTLDHNVLQRFLERIQIGMAGDATAIGDGVVTAVNRLKDVKAKSKVAILLTDGGNTAGRADPLAAANAAQAMGVKVYTIGVGGHGEVPVDVNGQVVMQKADVDEDLLKEISKRTGGQYFAADDTEALIKVYDTIDKLEKTRIKVESFEQFDDRFIGIAALAVFSILGEFAFLLTRFRSIP